MRNEMDKLISEIDDLKLESAGSKKEREKFEKEFGRLKGKGDGQRSRNRKFAIQLDS